MFKQTYTHQKVEHISVAIFSFIDEFVYYIIFVLFGYNYDVFLG